MQGRVGLSLFKKVRHGLPGNMRILCWRIELDSASDDIKKSRGTASLLVNRVLYSLSIRILVIRRIVSKAMSGGIVMGLMESKEARQMISVNRLFGLRD
jgi:hypothetical protein